MSKTNALPGKTPLNSVDCTVELNGVNDDAGGPSLFESIRKYDKRLASAAKRSLNVDAVAAIAAILSAFDNLLWPAESTMNVH